MYECNIISMRKKEKPLLNPLEPKDNGDGTYDCDFEYNTAFAKEFTRLTNQPPTAKNIAVWVEGILTTKPNDLQQYLVQIPES